MMTSPASSAEALAGLDELLQSLRSDEDVRAAQQLQQHQRSLLVQRQLQSLQSAFADVAQRNDSLSHDWQALAGVHQTLQAEYRTLRSSKERLQAEVEEERMMAAEQAQLRAEQLQEALAEVERRTACNGELEEEVAAFQVEQDSFRQQLQAVTAQLDEERRQRQSLQSTLAEAEQRLARSLQEAAELRAQLSTAEHEMQSMRAATSIAERELQAHEAIAKQIQQLSAQVLTVKKQPQPTPSTTAAATTKQPHTATRKERRVLEEKDLNESWEG